MSLADNPEIITKVGTLKAAGCNQEYIAEQIGCTQQHVSTLLNPKSPEKQDILKAIIENTRQQIILQTLPKAQENVKNCIDLALVKPPEESKFESDRRYWGLRYSEKLLESIGILGSQTPSVFIQQIFNTQNNLINNPVVRQFLDCQSKAVSNNTPDNGPNNITQEADYESTD